MENEEPHMPLCGAPVANGGKGLGGQCSQTRLMQGAEPLSIARGRPGACLLLHGWISTPADFGDLPQALDAAGWDVYAPLHAGHGTRPEDLEGLTADKLLDGARVHYAGLRARYEKVALAGFSMGGTMAVILSAEQPPDMLVLISPFLEVAYKWYYVLPVRWWHALLSPFVPYVARPAGLVRVNRPEGRTKVVAYDAFPRDATNALFALRRRAVEKTDLTRLKMPVLMVFSQGDEVSSVRAMNRFFAILPSQRKRAVALKRSNHIILHDYDRQEAMEAIASFLAEPWR